jgi:broad specificity phosphatase PhoE
MSVLRGAYSRFAAMDKKRVRCKGGSARIGGIAGARLAIVALAHDEARMELQGRLFVARHGETVFNASGRMQGQLHLHTPLTRTGFAQADAMGEALAEWLGTRQSLMIWSADSGRALQTLAIVCEHIGADWHEARVDARLNEIDVGEWSGRSYAEIIAEQGEIMDAESKLFSVRAPGGEFYDDVAARLSSWMAETAHERGDRLIIMHGMSSRVLRGLQRGLPVDPRFGAPIADSLPQGSMAMVGFGDEEKVICRGKGTERA